MEGMSESSASTMLGRTTYQLLFIIPITFQLGFSGCVFLNALKQRTIMLLARSRCESSTSTCQCNQVQNFLPCLMGKSGN